MGNPVGKEVWRSSTATPSSKWNYHKHWISSAGAFSIWEVESSRDGHATTALFFVLEQVTQRHKRLPTWSFPSNSSILSKPDWCRMEKEVIVPVCITAPCRNFEDPGGGSSTEGKMRDCLHSPTSTLSDLRASFPPKHSAASHHISSEASTNSQYSWCPFPKGKFPPLAQFQDLTLCSLKCRLCPDFS